MSKKQPTNYKELREIHAQLPLTDKDKKDSFWQDVYFASRDNLLKLVFADWLEEFGNDEDQKCAIALRWCAEYDRHPVFYTYGWVWSENGKFKGARPFPPMTNPTSWGVPRDDVEPNVEGSMRAAVGSDIFDALPKLPLEKREWTMEHAFWRLGSALILLHEAKGISTVPPGYPLTYPKEYKPFFGKEG